jgi:GAF domain-containing protein
MTIDPGDEASALLRASIDQLLAVLRAHETLETVLERVVDLACGTIGNCDLASVTWMSDHDAETITCTDPAAEQIDQVQYANDSGPCLYASRRREIVSVPSMTADDRWPPFREAAITFGVHSSFSLPLAAGEVNLGALNLYSREDHGFDAVPPDAALSFAQQAAAAVWTARTLEQTREMIRHLETALETRDIIGVAKGIVMANEKVSTEEAFAILRTASQQRNVKLRELAADVAVTGATPRSATKPRAAER